MISCYETRRWPKRATGRRSRKRYTFSSPDTAQPARRYRKATPDTFKMYTLDNEIPVMTPLLDVNLVIKVHQYLFHAASPVWQKSEHVLASKISSIRHICRCGLFKTYVLRGLRLTLYANWGDGFPMLLVVHRKTRGANTQLCGAKISRGWNSFLTCSRWTSS